MGQYSKTAKLLPFHAFIDNSLSKEFININLDALPSGKKKRDRNTSYSSHLHVIVDEHQFVQKPLWEISILQSKERREASSIKSVNKFTFKTIPDIGTTL
jgi:hypothetical protein